MAKLKAIPYIPTNRIYLAIPNGYKNAGFTEDEKYIANKFGVGLLEFEYKYKKVKSVYEVVISNYHEPITALREELLSKLEVYRCNLCGTYVSSSDISSRPTTKMEERDTLFYSKEVYRDKKIGAICKSCMENLKYALGLLEGEYENNGDDDY